MKYLNQHLRCLFKKFKLLSLLILVLFSMKSIACSCVSFSKEEQFNMAEEIVLAKVTKVELVSSDDEMRPWDIARTQYELIESFKRPKTNSKIIYADRNGCVPQLEVGDLYVFYISKDRNISICTGTSWPIGKLHSEYFDKLMTSLRKLSKEKKTI